ncbi:maestro heat-like repeat-containing protein family member 1 isoform X5 [Molossus molossus]|uniref:maestro heat-like repeat-containing protein family member 1 isoform X5 n=1 Tax=Molossus molossus TaxID=27622 RepID=UPI001745EA76|nr:maestro heat-like repeat-containing protein family member 1 isoform X5 [Molossus molossus]
MTDSYLKKLSTILLDAVTDKDPLVQEQVCSALCALGESQPEETLSTCVEYLGQHEKLAHPYRTMILRAMETVVSNHISELDKDMAKAVILLASSEMTKVKDLVCDWQQAASSVLVAVGKRFVGMVMEEMLGKFQPGVLPHCFVVQTLANLSISNVFGMVPFLTSVLSTMLPMLGMAKHDTMRVVFCCALQRFSESTLEYLANLDQAPDPTVRKDTFAFDISSAYDTLFYHWLQSREAKLRLAVVEALGPMSHLLPSEKLEEQLPKLLPGVLALYKKHAETSHVSKSLGQILEAAVSVGSRTLEVQLDSLLAALHAQICVPVESSSPLVTSNRKEVLRCFTVLACCSPERLLAFLLPKLDSSHERTRVGSLQVLRHIINSAAAQMEVKKPFILSSMRLPLLDTNSKVKRAVVQVISAMAHHGYLEQPGGEAMLEYIVQQCALPPDTQFLRDSLAVVSDNTWTCQLSLEMCKQLPCYNGTPQEKNFLYKCVGTALGAASSKDVVRKLLQELLETARYQEEAEREGLACCFGICAISHLDDTLAQLEDFVRSDVFRKSVGIFNIFKDRSDHEVEKVKGTLILCYGHVAARAPRELVLARAESDILRNMFQCFSTKVLGIKVETKDPALQLCLAQSVCMVCQAICSSAQAGSFHFSRKAELVSQMMDFIKAEPQDSLRTPIRKKAMLACTHLVSLEPELEEQAQTDMIHGCLHSVMAVLPEPEGEDGLQESLYLDTMHALEDLLRSTLRRNMTPQGLQIMVEHLSPWIKSPRGYERARALGLSACLLQFFLEHLCVSALVPFHNLGLLVGLFSPRCADLWPATRQEAVSCVYSLLYLQLGYEGFSHDYRDDVVERLLSLKDGLVHPDPAILFHTCHSVAQIIAKRLPPDQLISLLLTLFESLGDPDKNCSRAATVMINCLLKERGNMLLEKVPEIMSVLRSKLQETREEHVLQSAQHSVYLLASQHYVAVVSSLLGSPLPFDSHTCTLWRALAVEPSLTTQVLGLLLEKMNKDVPFKESRAFLLSSSPDRVATLLPLAATCALHEVTSAPASGPAVTELYPELFAGLLLRVSCTVGVQLPRNLQAKERRATSSASVSKTLDPCSSAVDALRAMLLRGGSEDVVQRMELERGWESLRTSVGHEDGVARLASAMAKFAGPRLPLVMKALLSTQSSVYEAQRVTSTAFLAELLNSNVVNDLMLLESLLNNLAARQKDPCASVRRLVLRGLANIASGSPNEVRTHGPQLLTAMISGLDDGDDPHSLVALEAMAGLAKLLGLVDPGDLRSVLLHTAIRIRPFFDSEKMEFRSVSIRLFGHLNKACHGDCEDVFLEQVVGGLVPLLLHLQDPQAPVAGACRFALRMCGPNLECEELAAVFQKHLQDGRGLHFGEFLNTTCKHLMCHFPDLLGRLVSTSLFYFKSSWEDVRAAAPMLTGFLVLHVEPQHRSQVDLEQLTAALQLLLKDPAPTVRVKAAETLGRLVKFA